MEVGVVQNQMWPLVVPLWMQTQVFESTIGKYSFFLGWYGKHPSHFEGTWLKRLRNRCSNRWHPLYSVRMAEDENLGISHALRRSKFVFSCQSPPVFDPSRPTTKKGEHTFREGVRLVRT
jgi:hypothetical protein